MESNIIKIIRIIILKGFSMLEKVFDFKINEKNVLVNGILLGFHPSEKKINWSSTNSGLAHLAFFLGTLFSLANNFLLILKSI